MVEQDHIMSTSKSLLDIRGIVVIPKLEQSSFETNVSGNIHWTPETANKMLTPLARPFKLSYIEDNHTPQTSQMGFATLRLLTYVI